MQEENKEIIFKTFKTYLLIYAIAMLAVIVLTGQRFNNLVMIVMLFFALNQLKKKNLLAIKTILVLNALVTFFFYISFSISNLR